MKQQLGEEGEIKLFLATKRKQEISQGGVVPWQFFKKGKQKHACSGLNCNCWIFLECEVFSMSVCLLLWIKWMPRCLDITSPS